MKKLFVLILAMLMLAVGCDEKETAKTPVEEPVEENGEVNYWIKGLEYYNEGDYEAAVEAFTLAIEDEPYPYDLMYRGETYLTLGGEENIALARADFEEALELDSSLTHASRCLAYVTYLEGDSEGAQELLENTLSEEVSSSLFDVCSLYCQECGSFEHLTHPAAYLEGKSDAELIEIANFAVEKYYDYTYPPIAFKSYGIELEEDDSYTLDEYYYTDGYQIIKLSDEEGRTNHAVIKCRYSGAVDAGFITFETDTFKFWGGNVSRQDGIEVKEYEIPFVAEYDEMRSGSYEGRLYDVAGKDITDAFVKSVKLYGCLSYPAQKSTNVTTIAEVTERCREHFSYKLLNNFTVFQFLSPALLEYNGELYCNVHMPGMGIEYPSVDYESAEVLSRTDNSFTVRYYFEYNELIPIFEAICTFGEENGNLVMLDIVEKEWYNAEVSAEHFAKMEDFELIVMSGERLSRYYNCVYPPFSAYAFGIETEDDGYGYYNEEVDGYQIVRLYADPQSRFDYDNSDYDNHVIKCRYKGVFDGGFFNLETDTFKLWWSMDGWDTEIKEYENRIDAEGVICSYEGRLYDLKGEDITDAFVKSVEQIGPTFVFPAGKSTNFNSLDEVKKLYRSYFSEELSKSFDSSLDRKSSSLEYIPPIEFNGGLYCNYYVPGMGFLSPWVDYSTGEIISRDGSSFAVRYEHDFDELISIKETICTYGEENGRIVLTSVEEIYFTPEEIEEHMNEIYENW